MFIEIENAVAHYVEKTKAQQEKPGFMEAFHDSGALLVRSVALDEG